MNKSTPSFIPEAQVVARRPVGSRVGAAVVDLSLMIGLFIFMCSRWGTLQTENGFTAELEGLPALIYFGIALGYFIAAEVIFSATIGKLVTGLRVVREDGSRLRLRDSVIRNLFRVIDGLPIFYLVGFVVMMRGPARQRLGDRVARTMVVPAHRQIGDEAKPG